jgi:alpha-ketoglutarate-dependent taurine dioxygenase
MVERYMIEEIPISVADPKIAFDALQAAWERSETKVIVLRSVDQIDDPKSFYNQNFPYIGKPAQLAEDVTVGGREDQRTGEVWTEVRYDPDFPDAYRHSLNAQPLHTDGSYIPDFPNATLMTCVTNAGQGGETTFIDGDDVVAALQAEAPDLLDALTSRILPHERTGDRRDEKVIDLREDGVWVNWNYYCVDAKVDATGRETADRFFKFLQSSPMIKEKTIPVKLAPGDGVTWKDRRILHGRNGFIANQVSERFLWKCAVDVGNFDR